MSEVAQPSIESARQTAFADLAHHAISGRLTLDEYAERVGAIELAATVDELHAALLDLPVEIASLPGPSAPHRGRWLFAVLGAAEQRGRWRLSSHLWIVAAFGRMKLDLGAAQPEAPQSVITVVVAFGGATILAPPGVSIQLSGFSLFGGKGDKRREGSSLPGSPLIRVRGFTIFGGINVKERRNMPKG